MTMINNERGLQIFENPEFGQVRTFEIEGKPYFVGIDVAKTLGYVDTHVAIRRHCKGVVKKTIPTNGGIQEVKGIPEGDIYRLITHSKLPSAERFERWVFDEVLPSIRKHGTYMTPEVIEKAILTPDFIIQLATALKEEREIKEQLAVKIEQDEPKVTFADAVTASETSILIGDLAKLLKQNGINIGQNRLFEWLRQNKYLISRMGSSRNLPSQKAMDLGLFVVTERTFISHFDGKQIIKVTPKVTGKGQIYFINLFRKKKLPMEL